VYLSGASATGITLNSGTGTINLVSASSLLSIPTNNLIITASGSPWNGILRAPTVTQTGGTILVGGSLISSSFVYSLGSPGTELLLSGGMATITLFVPVGALQGVNLPVYRSDNGGSTYVLVTNCTISNTFTCTFTTNHFSLFAIGVPPVVSVPGGGSSSGPGGPIGGWINPMWNVIFGGSTGIQYPVMPIPGISPNVIIKKPILGNIQKVLFYSKSLYKINSPKIVNIYTSKSLSSRTIGYFKAGKMLRIKYMDSMGWSLVVAPSGQWGFIRSEYLTQI
ncbi:SH3 domain-containing protein, partial [Candidatus Gracilibacteria bacterium]|nr:SH3 domain-containing protein [Candidatus Gracilibacteria bacterium]